jgi:hypothetical protein
MTPNVPSTPISPSPKTKGSLLLRPQDSKDQEKTKSSDKKKRILKKNVSSVSDVTYMIPGKPKPKTPTEFEIETEERIHYMRDRQMMIDRARNNI